MEGAGTVAQEEHHLRHGQRRRPRTLRAWLPPHELRRGHRVKRLARI